MKNFPRSGAWGVINGQVGILYLDVKRDRQGRATESVPEFHIVDSNGDTATIVRPANWNSARIAKASEIPAKRIVGLTSEQLAVMGYK